MPVFRRRGAAKQVPRQVAWCGDALPEHWEGPLSGAAATELSTRAARLRHVDLARRTPDVGAPTSAQRLRLCGVGQAYDWSPAAIADSLSPVLAGCAEQTYVCFHPDDAGHCFVSFRTAQAAERAQRALRDVGVKAVTDASPHRRLGGAVPADLAADPKQVGMRVRMRRGRAVRSVREGEEEVVTWEPDSDVLMGQVLATDAEGVHVAWEQLDESGELVPHGRTVESWDWWSSPEARPRGAGVGHALGSALSTQGCRLRELRLGGGGISALCASALARGIAGNTSLHLLDLTDSPSLGDAGAVAIARVASGTNLEELVLARCSLTDAAVAAVAPLLNYSVGRLVRLSVAGNPGVTQQAAKVITREAKQRRSPIRVSVAGCSAGAAGESRVAAACATAAIRGRRIAPLFALWRARLQLAEARRRAAGGRYPSRRHATQLGTCRRSAQDALLTLAFMKDARTSVASARVAAAQMLSATAGLWRPSNLLFAPDVAAAATVAVLAATAWADRYGEDPEHPDDSAGASTEEETSSLGPLSVPSPRHSVHASPDCGELHSRRRPTEVAVQGLWVCVRSGERCVVQQHASFASSQNPDEHSHVECVSLTTGNTHWILRGLPPAAGGSPVPITLVAAGGGEVPATLRVSGSQHTAEVHVAREVVVLHRAGGASRHWPQAAAARRGAAAALAHRWAAQVEQLGEVEAALPDMLSALFDRFDSAKTGTLSPRAMRKALAAYRSALPDAVCGAAAAAIAEKLWHEIGAALDGSGVAPDGDLSAAIAVWVKSGEDYVAMLKQHSVRAVRAEERADLRKLRRGGAGALTTKREFVARGVQCIEQISAPTFSSVLVGEHMTPAAALAAAPAALCDDWHAEYPMSPATPTGRVRVRADGGGLVATKIHGGPCSVAAGAVLWRSADTPQPGVDVRGSLVAATSDLPDVPVHVSLRDDGALVVTAAALVRTYGREEYNAPPLDLTTPRAP
eukprot:TRINITY_DN13152_c0_g1_i1.p1 TRINITY_DN13152_c0_g1~~TRINITY_DN13152_c0_g1_i1.p1  ORF type:complete len:987 (+),score=267.23 TRINITY_DN13152_c0_g1_i1:43-2961(+)